MKLIVFLFVFLAISVNGSIVLDFCIKNPSYLDCYDLLLFVRTLKNNKFLMLYPKSGDIVRDLNSIYYPQIKNWIIAVFMLDKKRYPTFLELDVEQMEIHQKLIYNQIL